MQSVDICVVGAGPAGLSAATMASHHGLTVALLDERPSAGGQIYRGLEDGPFRNGSSLGSDYAKGRTIIDAFRGAQVEAHFGANLWRVDMTDDGGIASFGKDGVTRRLAFRKLVLATGAIERPVAFEGWTLPGVMSIGGAQLLLKSSGIAPSGNIALAGNGPLLLLFASQLVGMGVQVSAILDTAPTISRAALGFKHFATLLRNREKLAKGARMMRDIRAAGIVVHRNVASLSASGGDRLTSVAFEADGKRETLETETLLVHEGILPNTQLSRALNCRHVWDDGQRCLKPELDSFGESSVPNIFIIGDGAAIDGALAAPASAQIAVARILEQMGRADDGSRAIAARAAATFRAERRFRPFLDALYPPRIATAAVSDNTVVCRCEDVRAATLRAAVRDGAIGPAQAKAFTRCGMGPCQGRMCGPIVSQLIASETQHSIADVGAYNVRFPLKPVTLGEMARCGADEDRNEKHHAA